jgi:hypothetical protein
VSEASGSSAAAERAQEKATSLADEFTRFARDQPIATVLSALIIGYILAKIT